MCIRDSPNTLIESYVFENVLYVHREQYGAGIEIDDAPRFFSSMSGANKHTIRADSARPEIISYMNRNGYKLQSAEKWAGSVEDGISKLRSFDQIVIHSRCKHTAEEAKLWKYKRDRLTGDVLPQLIDKNNHCSVSYTHLTLPTIYSV